jgi:hypothetical protein
LDGIAEASPPLNDVKNLSIVARTAMGAQPVARAGVRRPSR